MTKPIKERSHSLDARLGYQLRRAQLRAFAALSQAIGSDGLTPMLFAVLVTIAEGGGVTQREVADALGADPSTMVRMLDQLEKLSLVQRVPSLTDRRVMVPTLTAAGRELIARATPKVQESEDAFAAALSPAQRAQLFDLLSRLNEEHDDQSAVEPSSRR